MFTVFTPSTDFLLKSHHHKKKIKHPGNNPAMMYCLTMKASGGPKPPPQAERDGEAPRGPIDSVTRVYERQER